jgi:4-alpha-glucanotransferase
MDRYADSREENPAWRLIRMAMASVAEMCVIPLQDVLALGTEARLNMPGTVGGGNWSWRAAPGCLTDAVMQKLKEMVELYGRA